MKQFIITATAALTTIMAQAQVTETREAKNATSIEVKNGIELIVSQGETPALKAEAANAEVLNNLVTEFRKGTLKVYFKNSSADMVYAKGVKVYVTEKDIAHIKVTNGAVLKTGTPLKTDDIDVQLSNGGSFSGELYTTGTCHIKTTGGAGFRGTVHANKLRAVALSGGFIKVLGQADTTEVFSNGGSVQAAKLICKSASVMAQANAAIAINASELVEADSDASSTVTYYGDPKRAVTGNNTYSIQRDTQKLTLN